MVNQLTIQAALVLEAQVVVEMVATGHLELLLLPTQVVVEVVQGITIARIDLVVMVVQV